MKMSVIKTHVVEILMELILVNANQVGGLRPMEMDNSASSRVVLTLVTVQHQLHLPHR